MPSILTHYIFFKEIEKEDLDIGNIGSQGPDPFFFYFVGVKKYENTKIMCESGTLMHKIDPTSTFLYFYEYANKESEENKEIIYQYLKGFISHYALDSVVHPYVFYKSGFALSDNKEEKDKYFLDHVLLESNLDVLISDHYNYKISPKNTLKFNKKKINVISKMYQSYLKHEFNIENMDENTFTVAVKRMRLTFKIVYSRFQIKKCLFNTFMKNTKVNMFSNQSLKKCKKDDYLNLNHSEYHDATTNELIGNYSLIDLFSLAEQKYLKIKEILFSDISLSNKKEKLKELIANINYDGFKIGAKKLYFNSFFK